MANSLVETEPKLAWNIQHTAVRATTEFTPVRRQNSSKELNAKEKEMLILQIDQRIISQPKGVYWIVYRNIELKYVYLEKSRFWKLVYIFHTWLHRFNRNKLSSLLELFAKKYHNNTNEWHVYFDWKILRQNQPFHVQFITNELIEIAIICFFHKFDLLVQPAVQIDEFS